LRGITTAGPADPIDARLILTLNVPATAVRRIAPDSRGRPQACERPQAHARSQEENWSG